MRKLLDFIISKGSWGLFILLEILSFVLIYRDNHYQRTAILSSANVIVGNISSISGNVRSYFNLRSINRDLAEKNSYMEMELLKLQDQIDLMKADTVTFKGFIEGSDDSFSYDFVMARVLNNSVGHISNYITIDKGSKDGIAKDMGVVSENGVVGVVVTVSESMSVVLPILNSNSTLSCKVKGSGYGFLNWDGANLQYAKMKISRHMNIQEGDTIVTSGYSSIFPVGLIVGTISSSERHTDDNFYLLDVRLSANFQTLSNVRVIRNYRRAEQIDLEQIANVMN